MGCQLLVFVLVLVSRRLDLLDIYYEIASGGEIEKAGTYSGNYRGTHRCRFFKNIHLQYIEAIDIRHDLPPDLGFRAAAGRVRPSSG